MATTPFNSSVDGQRITVNAMIRRPAVVRARMIDMFGQQFITDALLRSGPRADGGAVLYNESTPLYADENSAIVEEYGEIPATTGQLGQPKMARTVKRALALLVSQEMRDRDDVGAVDLQQTQIRNTIVRDHENTFLSAVLNNAGINTLAATAAWSSGTSKIRYDLAQAMYKISNSDADSTNGTGTNKFQFEPDTLVISRKSEADFLSSDDIAKVFISSPLANENLQYTGKMPRQFFGLDVIRTWQMPSNQALVLQRKVIGGVSDERPLQVGPGWVEDPKRETFWMKVLRRSAVFIDQPKAACLITGV